MARKLAQTLPAFTPVPRQCDRSNGWKPEVQRAFIEALADTGSVRAACRRVHRSDGSAYQLRRHPEAGEFRKAWDAASDLGVRRLEDAALERALHGVVEHICHRDKVIVRRRYDNRLLMFILRNRAPRRFAEGRARGLSAVDRQMLKRLRKQWRHEWAAEQLAAQPDIEEVRANILRKIEAFERADRQRWTPREQELHAALDEERARRAAREEAEALARAQRWQPREPDEPTLLEAREDPDDRE